MEINEPFCQDAIKAKGANLNAFRGQASKVNDWRRSAGDGSSGDCDTGESTPQLSEGDVATQLQLTVKRRECRPSTARYRNFSRKARGTSLVVQCLRLHAPNAGGSGSIPGQGTKMPQAAAKPAHSRACARQLESHSEDPAQPEINKWIKKK